MKSYRLRRQYNDSWIYHLWAKTATAKNRVPLDLQNILELDNLLRKINEFILTEIKRQILFTRRKEIQRHEYILKDKYICYIFRHYELPYLYIIFIDDISIPLTNISPFWYLENFDQCIFFPMNCINDRLEPITNLFNAHLTLHFCNQINCSLNNISINEITHASQINCSIMYEEYLNEKLNYRICVSQTINFEEKISQYIETYRTTPSSIQNKIYHELDR